MKVLAYRSNKIFFTAPILVPLCIIIALEMVQSIHTMYGWRWELFIGILGVMISQLVGFVERLFMPKVLIEYDNRGLYIYKYRKSEPILLRYENIWDCRAQINEGSEDIPLSMDYSSKKFDSYERAAISSKSLVGLLKFNTPHEIITVHGIKNVKSVERELASIRYDFKEKQEEWLDYNIEKSRRNKELEELAKHDINT